jgi:hypothetical protein
MSEEDSNFCMVIFWSRKRNRAMVQRYRGMLFGLSGAVVAFNRWPSLCQAMSRRILVTLTSFYFDDSNISDWASERGGGQRALNDLMEILGSPFAADKSQPMAEKGVFLGLSHDFRHCIREGFVRVWIKPQLRSKVKGIINRCLSSELCTPATAEKLYGCLNFLDSGAFGHILRGGMNALKDRIHRVHPEEGNEVSPRIGKCLQTVLDILEREPRRTVPSRPLQWERFLAASDAAQEGDSMTGGYLLEIKPAYRSGAWMKMGEEVTSVWSAGEKKIAQLELLMVWDTLASEASSVRGKQGLFFIDNQAALMSLVNGRSNNEDLDKMAHMIRGLMFELRIAVYFEWIESKANWSDGVSRDGSKDQWAKKHLFHLKESRPVMRIWGLPFKLLLRVCAFV